MEGEDMTAPCAGVVSEPRPLAVPAREGNLEKLKALIEAGADPRERRSEALMLAVINRHAECVEFLAPLSNARQLKSGALMVAAGNGDVKCLRALLPFSCLRANGLSAMEVAARADQPECLSLVAAACESHLGPLHTVLAEAARSGGSACVKLVLELQPGARRSAAMSEAISCGNVDGARALLHGGGLLATKKKAAMLLAEARQKGASEIERLILSHLERSYLRAAIATPNAAPRPRARL